MTSRNNRRAIALCAGLVPLANSSLLSAATPKKASASQFFRRRRSAMPIVRRWAGGSTTGQRIHTSRSGDESGPWSDFGG